MAVVYVVVVEFDVRKAPSRFGPTAAAAKKNVANATSNIHPSNSAPPQMPPKPPPIPLAALRAGAKPHPTHFTATRPHAAVQPPPPRITTIGIPKAAANETPRQKVARLREAARVARIRDLPWTDKLVETTRVWADVTHRWFVVFIMGISGLSHNTPFPTPCAD
jgi:hypothetical protein